MYTMVRNKPGRGSLPYSWEVTLPDLEIQPALLQMFYEQATANDTFVAALSGPGYMYPKSSGKHLPRMLALAAQSMATLDLDVMVTFDATYAPILLSFCLAVKDNLAHCLKAVVHILVAIRVVARRRSVTPRCLRTSLPSTQRGCRMQPAS